MNNDKINDEWLYNLSEESLIHEWDNEEIENIKYDFSEEYYKGLLQTIFSKSPACKPFLVSSTGTLSEENVLTYRLDEFEGPLDLLLTLCKAHFFYLQNS